MNNKTKIIIGVGVAALLFMFRKQIFGGANSEDEETSTKPNENVEVTTKTSTDTVFKPFVPVMPNLVNVNTEFTRQPFVPPTPVNPNVTSSVDSALFSYARPESSFALGGR